MEVPVKDGYKKRYAEFQKLNTLELKLEFWNSGNLPLNFIEYQECSDDELYNDLRPFAFEDDLPQDK